MSSGASETKEEAAAKVVAFIEEEQRRRAVEEKDVDFIQFFKDVQFRSHDLGHLAANKTLIMSVIQDPKHSIYRRAALANLHFFYIVMRCYDLSSIPYLSSFLSLYNNIGNPLKRLYDL